MPIWNQTAEFNWFAQKSNCDLNVSEKWSHWAKMNQWKMKKYWPGKKKKKMHTKLQTTNFIFEARENHTHGEFSGGGI